MRQTRLVEEEGCGYAPPSPQRYMLPRGPRGSFGAARAASEAAGGPISPGNECPSQQ